MRYLLVGAALAAIAAPAAARDHSAYFGLEIGALFPLDSHVDESTGANVLNINHKLGVDGDLIAGYDFGIFRAEFEAGHKWAKHKNYDLASGATVGGDGHTSSYSTMINAMIDLGDNRSFNFYAGGGAGLTWIHQQARWPVTPTATASLDINDKEHFAWQGIAGVRAPVFRYFDIGLKYRYFDAGHIQDNGIRSRVRSHSLLASLIYNFGPDEVAPPPPPPMAPPPPPPPPPPPATQTCPDGTVILATDACPAPPPPPPPPAPTPERGN
jgi:OOP family OmpA-OmpF porin